jgi:hypothetical protein
VVSCSSTDVLLLSAIYQLLTVFKAFQKHALLGPVLVINYALEWSTRTRAVKIMTITITMDGLSMLPTFKEQ